MDLGFTPVLAFIAVVVAIPAVLWLLKRTPLGGGGAAGPLKLVTVLPLSAAQKLVVVEAGTGSQRQWLVLGVTPQQINTLHTLPAGEVAALPQGFGQAMARFTGKTKAPQA